MLSSKLVRPVTALCSVTSTRTLRAYPTYKNIADGDREADLTFDIEYGIKPAPPSLAELNTHDKPKDEFGQQSFINYFYRAKLRWDNFFGGELPYKQSADEKAERVILMDRLHEFYAEVPQHYPDRQWYLDFLDHCVRFNDVNTLVIMHDWMTLMKINVDADILEKFNHIRHRNLPVGLTELSPWRQERELSAYIPEHNPEASWLRRKGPYWEDDVLSQHPVYEGSIKNWVHPLHK